MQPLTALQWVHMSLMFDNRVNDTEVFSHENPMHRKEVGRSLCKAFDNLLGVYHKKVSEEGVEVEAPRPKRVRKGRAAPKSNGANGKAQDAGSFSSLGNIVYFGNTTHVSSYACNDHMMYIVIPD